MSRDLNIEKFADTHFCFNNETVNVNFGENSEFLLPLCLLQQLQALLDVDGDKKTTYTSVWP